MMSDTDTAGPSRGEELESRASLEDYFMGIALLCAKRSKDKDTQVGACVVNGDNQVIGTGYNGMPLNCHDCLNMWGAHDEQNTVDESSEVDDSGARGKRKQKKSQSASSGKLRKMEKPKHNHGIGKVVYLSDDRNEKPTFIAGRDILVQGKCEPVRFAGKFKAQKLVLDINGKTKVEKSESRTTKESQKSEKQIISWEQFFMSMAKLSADLRSSTDLKQGACVVNEDNRIVGLGYIDDSCAPTPENEKANKKGKKPSREKYICHAPVVAIVNKNPTSLRNCTLYVTNHPCKECAKVIVQSGIHKVYYMEKIEVKQGEEDRLDEKTHDGCYVVQPPPKQTGEKQVNAATQMFAIAHIKVKKFRPKVDFQDMETGDVKKYSQVELDFAEVVAKKE